jgi:hypothetical protein
MLAAVDRDIDRGGAYRVQKVAAERGSFGASAPALAGPESRRRGSNTCTVSACASGPKFGQRLPACQAGGLPQRKPGWLQQSRARVFA